jgi:hypothetical protein
MQAFGQDGCQCCSCGCNSSPCAIPSQGDQGSGQAYQSMMNLVQQLLNRQPLPGPPGPPGAQFRMPLHQPGVSCGRDKGQLLKVSPAPLTL